MPTNPRRQFITLDEAGEPAGEYPIAIKTLRLWIAEGRLASYKPGRRVLIKRDELEALITSTRRGA